MWAVWMASMTSHPLATIYGLDFNKWYELVIRPYRYEFALSAPPQQ